MSHNKKYKATIMVSDDELNALEDMLIGWILCKKHKAMAHDPETFEARTDQEIYKMQDECQACQRLKGLTFNKAWHINGMLFEAVERNRKADFQQDKMKAPWDNKEDEAWGKETKLAALRQVRGILTPKEAKEVHARIEKLRKGRRIQTNKRIKRIQKALKRLPVA